MTEGHGKGWHVWVVAALACCLMVPLTGRAGASGDAISLIAPEEERYLLDIEKLTKHKVERAI